MTRIPAYLALVSSAAVALKDRKDEVNRLNVFPVPDGDTGTNMSLTMDAVIAELRELPDDASIKQVCHAITQGSLMGARGNSGVILSQILRGLCDSIAVSTVLDQAAIASSLDRSREVAFQAVRKPVEGTMLTVLKDSAIEAQAAHTRGDELEAMLEAVTHAAFDSVRRTPELLPVLKENNVVDAGGYGLAILAEGLLAAYKGAPVVIEDVAMAAAPSVALSIEPDDDWDDDEFLYCTEFLLFGEALDREALETYVSAQGGSELVVGDAAMLKVHVHTDDPGSVLAHMTSLGEVAEVHINNMRRQTAERSATLRSESTQIKPYTVVTVAVGEGIRKILESLGADVIVNGGQTMNPSTAEILEAAATVNAENVIILPNNKNIQMAAQQAAEVSGRPTGVIPTTSVPEAFAALLMFDADASLDDNIAAMTEALSSVRSGEITTAVKDSKAKVGDIKAGQVIGITAGEIEVVGEDVKDVTTALVGLMLDDGEMVTILAGQDLDDGELEALVAAIQDEYPEVDVESHRGEQPLYPVIVSVE